MLKPNEDWEFFVITGSYEHNAATVTTECETLDEATAYAKDHMRHTGFDCTQYCDIECYINGDLYHTIDARIQLTW